jgi:hypothetical protein
MANAKRDFGDFAELHILKGLAALTYREENKGLSSSFPKMCYCP